MILWVRITKATGKVSKYFLFLVDQPKNKSEQGHTKINPKSIDARVPIFAARTVSDGRLEDPKRKIQTKA
jgi:hypothetical protein